MFDNVDPLTGFWLADDGRIFSARDRSLIEATDPIYAARAAAGLVAQPWPRDEAGEQTSASLQAVLAPYGVWVDLSYLKAAMLAGTDAAAEAERMKYITPGTGQAMTYQQKASEAVMLEDDPSPDPGDYPLLSAEVGITAPTLAEVGAVVRQAHGAWILLGAGIEAVRLSAKKAIAEAATAEEAQAAAAVEWPSPPA